MVAKLNYGKQVRIFVFSFRKNEGLYSDRLKGLACSNRGYYSKILYFGQIEAALQRLVQVPNLATILGFIISCDIPSILKQFIP